MEDEIEKSRSSRGHDEDVSLWLKGKGQYKKVFSSKGTWELIRGKHQLCHWDNLVWFKYATPKNLFILWMALKGRLATGDRMRYWDGNTNVACVLCNEPLGTLEHLLASFDKNMRNKLFLVQRKGDSIIGKGMQYWFHKR